MVYIKSLMTWSIISFNLIFSSFVGDCDYDPLVSEILNEANPSRWINWIKALSGAEPIQTQNGEGKILTRSSLVLFEPDLPRARSTIYRRKDFIRRTYGQHLWTGITFGPWC